VEEAICGNRGKGRDRECEEDWKRGEGKNGNDMSNVQIVET